MSQLLFEDPFWLFFLIGLVAIVLVAMWWKKPTRSRALRILIPVGLAAAVYLIEITVVTDREKLIGAVEKIAEHARQGKTDALEQYLSEEFEGRFRGRAYDKQGAIDLAERSLREHGLVELVITRLDVEVKGRTARMNVVTRMILRSLGGRAPIVLRWDIAWNKSEGRWRAVKAEEPLMRL